MTKTLSDFIRQTVLLVLGSACRSCREGHSHPSRLSGARPDGAALLVHYSLPMLPVGTLYLLMNIPVFCLGWHLVGARFALYSLWGMVIYSAMLYLITFQIEIADKMLSTVVAGACSGIGVAVILRTYGSTGGAEILCVILHKIFAISLGTGSILMNAAILAVGGVLFPMENVLYTLVYVAVAPGPPTWSFTAWRNAGRRSSSPTDGGKSHRS